MPDIKNTNGLKEIKGFEVSGHKWLMRNDLPKHQQWSSNWYCPDGDSAELYIDKDFCGFSLSCFGGVGCSEIVVKDIDFHSLWNGKFKDTTGDEPIQNFTKNQQCIILADCFCKLFCEWFNEKVKDPNELPF